MYQQMSEGEGRGGPRGGWGEWWGGGAAGWSAGKESSLRSCQFIISDGDRDMKEGIYI